MRLGIYSSTASSGTTGLLADTVATLDVTSSPGASFVPYTLSYTTGAVAPGGTLVVGISQIDTNWTSQTMYAADALSLDGTLVPEPSVLPLAGACLVAMVVCRRRGGRWSSRGRCRPG